MKYRFKLKKKLEIPGLGIVTPGQEFNVENPAYKPLFEDKTLFEPIKNPIKPKKESKKIKESE